MSIRVPFVHSLLFQSLSVNYRAVLTYDAVFLVNEILKQHFLYRSGLVPFVFDIGMSAGGLYLSDRSISMEESPPFLFQALIARRIFILTGGDLKFFDFGQEILSYLDKTVWSLLFLEIACSLYMIKQYPTQPETSDQWMRVNTLSC